MKEQYKKFKELTGKRGADIADSNNCSRQYVSTLINHPTEYGEYRLSGMMRKVITEVMEQKEEELQKLFELYEEIGRGKLP